MSFTGSVQAVLGTEKMISGIYAGAGIPGNPLASNWRAQLRPASLGGVPFAVWGGQLRVGRRNAVHEYPFKDEVWVEDLGRAARRITLTGFIVENAVYGGGNVIQQRDRLIAVCESRDQKTLVHPTLGSLNVSLLDSAMEERWDQGRMFEVSFSFIEAGQRVFPRADVSTGVVVDSAADAAEAALSGDFEASIGSALSQGQAVVDMAVSTATAWAGNAVALAGDATNLINTVGSLSGSYSRYFGGRNRGFQNVTAQLSMPTTTITGLVAAGTVARQGVATASSALTAAAAEIAS